MNREIEIIFEDDDIIVCHKPAGVATQTKRLGQQDMETLLKNYRAKKGELPYIGVVHRLDQPVEGVMVFAKNPKAAAGLSKQVQNRMIGKYYYAISVCKPKCEEGVLENYLLTDKKANYSKVVDVNMHKDAKKATLEYKVIEQREGKTFFDIKLHTGRQHQIRVQMAHMGCPLIGDSKYAKMDVITQSNFSQNGLALCSYRLEFLHPSTAQKMNYEIKPKGAIFN